MQKNKNNTVPIPENREGGLLKHLKNKIMFALFGYDSGGRVKLRKFDGSEFTGIVLREKYISQGKLHQIYEVSIKKEQRELIFVVKERKDGNPISKNELNRELEVFKLIKEIGISTFNTFRAGADGKFYSTLLNKDGLVAISPNNDIPVGYQDEFKGGIKINNLQQVVDKLIDYAVNASKKGLILASDSLWFMLPSENNAEGIDIVDIKVTDFGECKVDEKLKGNVAKKMIEGFYRETVSAFVDKYCNGDNLMECKQLIKDSFRPQLASGQIFVQKGVKQFDDYNAENDGEILDGLMIFDENTTLDTINKFSEYFWVEVYTKGFKQEYKNQMTKFYGTLEDDSENIKYENLEIINGGLDTYLAKSFFADKLKINGGNLVLHNCTSFSVESLVVNGGNIVAGKLREFVADSLRTVDGEISLTGATIVSIKSLSEVGRIYLRKNNFKEFLNEESEVDDDFYKKAKKAGRLIIPEKMIEKITWIN